MNLFIHLLRSSSLFCKTRSMSIRDDFFVQLKTTGASTFFRCHMSIVEGRGDTHEHVLELGIVVIGHFALKLEVAILQRKTVVFFYEMSMFR